MELTLNKIIEAQDKLKTSKTLEDIKKVLHSLGEGYTAIIHPDSEDLQAFILGEVPEAVIKHNPLIDKNSVISIDVKKLPNGVYWGC
jgi:hypothetical protein